MAPGIATVLYPTGEDFNMKYYLDKHMPLVHESWKSFGLTGWTVIQLDPSGGYQVQALLYWSDIEGFKKATEGPTAATVMGDIPKFTKVKPLIIAGGQVAKA